MHVHGNKDDAEKPRMDLLDPHWLLDVGAVLTRGAAKYGEYNWRSIQYHRYIAASYRHLAALQAGEYIDPDDNLPHAAHLACNAMFLHYLGAHDESPNVQRHEDRDASVDTRPEQSITPRVSKHHEKLKRKFRERYERLNSEPDKVLSRG